MRVLVTGGAGYIGSVMVQMLRGEGHDVLVLDNMYRGHRAALSGAELSEVDLRDTANVESVCRFFKPQACIHFAALSLVGESVLMPIEYYLVNVGGTLNLLRGLSLAMCPYMVFSSSAAVYGDPGVSPITVEAPVAPINPYGVTKTMVEKVLRDLAASGVMVYVSLRYFNAAGADTQNGLGEDHNPETHLIPRVISAAMGASPGVTIYGSDYDTPDGTCVRDYVHVTDLCRAHLLALDYLADGGSPGVYNLGNGTGFSVREVVDTVREVSGVEFDVLVGDRREGDPPVLVASSERIAKDMGWKPSFNRLEDIVKTAWEWHTAHPLGYGD